MGSAMDCPHDETWESQALSIGSITHSLASHCFHVNLRRSRSAVDSRASASCTSSLLIWGFDIFFAFLRLEVKTRAAAHARVAERTSMARVGSRVICDW